jgi:hypothetical protein
MARTLPQAARVGWRAVAERYEIRKIGSELAVCQSCGSAVENVVVHDRWHIELRLAAGQPIPARDVLDPLGKRARVAPHPQ